MSIVRLQADHGFVTKKLIKSIFSKVLIICAYYFVFLFNNFYVHFGVLFICSPFIELLRILRSSKTCIALTNLNLRPSHWFAVV